MLTRRSALEVAAAGTLLALHKNAQALPPDANSVKSTAAGTHALVPLPFNPAKLTNISEKLITSHHANNYGAAVKNLNLVELDLASLPKDAPGFALSGLKQNELLFGNSVALHELYFGNLGGDGRAHGAVEKALAATHGSLAAWEAQFKALGASLGGGSGWAILDLDLRTGALASHWSGNHTQVPVMRQPLLVMDMYEHSYQMDFGAAAARYVDAFFQNIQWDEVNRRFERALKARTALQG